MEVVQKDFDKASKCKSNGGKFCSIVRNGSKSGSRNENTFSTSNPHEMTEEVFRVIAKYDNVCKYIHLPVQSGSDRILQKMNRQHTRQEYLDLIKKAKK